MCLPQAKEEWPGFSCNYYHHNINMLNGEAGGKLSCKAFA